MGKLFLIALAPIIICAVYLYIRDKYEKEPYRLLITGVLYGILITFPIIHTEELVLIFIPNAGVLAEAAFLSFVVASLVEETYKYAVLFFLLWKNKNLNEPYDGIIYAAFISLGFATLENFLYVFNPELGGLETGYMRAVFSVPGHALFGISMGYYFALAKLDTKRHMNCLISAFFVPWLLHGIYDFILLSGMKYLMLIFIPFLIFLWSSGFKKIKSHLENSPFKDRKRFREGS